jgi:plastocyanin domain-containing protein
MKQALAILFLVFGFSFANAGQSQGKHQYVELQVTEKGFEPSQIDVKPDTAITLKVTRKTDNTCATAISIPSKKIKKDLPLNKIVSIDLGKLEKGEIRFACGMDMVSGQIIVR